MTQKAFSATNPHMAEELREFGNKEFVSIRAQFGGKRDFLGQEIDEIILKIKNLFTIENLIGYLNTGNKSACDYLQSDWASRPFLCAQMTKEVCMAAFEFAKVGLQNQRPLQFVAFYDFCAGGFSLINQIILAEAEISGRAKDSITKRLDAESTNYPLEFKVDVFLQIKRSLIDAERLLVADPTGFNLLEVKLEEMKECFSRGEQEPHLLWLDRFSIPEFAIAGAEFAQEVYKKCYQISNSRPSAP